jgi:predicted transposase/invertase (TIGR01784 family)
MASRVLVTISRDEKEQARLMSEFKYEVDTQSRILNAEWRGEQKGRLEGRLEGIVEGERKGKMEEKMEIAKALKDTGESVDRIILVTGLSFDEIAKL